MDPKIRLVVAFLVGTALFTVLPRFGFPTPLQLAEIGMAVVGLAGAVLVGALLFLIVGGARAVWPLVLCPLFGAFLFQPIFLNPLHPDVEPDFSTTLALALLVWVPYLLPTFLGALIGRAVLALARRSRAESG